VRAARRTCMCELMGTVSVMHVARSNRPRRWMQWCTKSRPSSNMQIHFEHAPRLFECFGRCSLPFLLLLFYRTWGKHRGDCGQASHSQRRYNMCRAGRRDSGRSVEQQRRQHERELCSSRPPTEQHALRNKPQQCFKSTFESIFELAWSTVSNKRARCPRSAGAHAQHRAPRMSRHHPPAIQRPSWPP